MAKCLQVILQEPEYCEIQRVARARRISIAEWVRQALALARRREPSTIRKKTAAVRATDLHNGPTADIRRTDFIQHAFDAMLGFTDQVFAIEQAAAERAKEIVLGHPRLSARDAIYLAVMEEQKVGRTRSFDLGLEGFPGIERLH